MILRLFLFLGLLSLPVFAQEVNPEDALRNALLELQSDIERDSNALNDLRARIDAERTPLATQLETLRNTVAERRAELDRIRQVRTQGQRDQQALESRTKALEEERTYLRSLFAEYARAIDTRMNIARPEDLTKNLEAAREGLDGNTDLADALETLLSTSLNWNEQNIGGHLFNGAALDGAGIEQPGQFATLGPTAYFAAEMTDGPTGIALLRFGSDNPAVYEDLPQEVLTAIRDLTQGKTASVPVDASAGDAIRIAEASPGLWDHLKQGGFTMFPLAAVAIAALLLTAWKGIDLARMRIEDEPQVQAVLDALRANDVSTANTQAQAVRFPLRRLVDDLIAHHDAPREHLEEIMHEHVLASLPYIERNLGAISVLGGVAPLLGLLGTVTGMIQTFQLVTLFGSGDAKLLSSGISEALVTTETGLAIAIPTLLLHAFLSRRARGIVGALETQATTMVNDLKLRS